MTWVQYVQRCNLVRSINRQRNRATERGAEQRMIVSLDQRDGETGSKGCHSTDRPPIRQLLWPAKMIDGQQVRVAENEVVGRIEGGQSAAYSRVYRIKLLAIS